MTEADTTQLVNEMRARRDEYLEAVRKLRAHVPEGKAKEFNLPEQRVRADQILATPHPDGPLLTAMVDALEFAYTANERLTDGSLKDPVVQWLLRPTHQRTVGNLLSVIEEHIGRNRAVERFDPDPAPLVDEVEEYAQILEDSAAEIEREFPK